MPYKNCQFILEDGYRCNRTFSVTTNRSSRKMCPEHENKEISKGAGIRKIQAKQEYMRKFLDDLYTYKIDEIDSRLTRMRERQTALDRKMDRVIENMEKLDENFSKMKKLNSEITESIYNRGPVSYDKIQQQLITLNNKIIKMQRSDENDKRNRRTRKDME